jgi:SAM-dependent methyltransferase
MALRLRSRRSNVRHEIFGDMTTAPLMSETFDGVIAAEVLEHVEADTEFVHEVWRVLKPGGFFLATTPNGDSLPLVPGRSLDHKRHYTRQELKLLLGSVFPSVNVRYAVRRSRFFAMGIRSWSLTAPVQTGGAMLGNFLNWFESRGVESQAHGTQQLIALATKPVREPGGRSPGLRTNASMILTDAAGRAPRRR